MLAAALASAVLVVEAAEIPAPSDTASDIHAAPSAAVSVYEVDPLSDGLILGTTALSWAVLSLAGPNWVTPHCPCSPADVPGIDRVALKWHSQTADVLSTVTEVLALLAPLGVDLVDVGFGKVLLEDMVVYGEVLSISGTVTTATKFAVQRPRPYVYGTTSTAVLNSPASYTSFFSGHSSATFGALTTLAMTESLRHGTSVWPWLIVGLVGTSVAVERVLAGQHFPTDVIAGAAVGVATGVLVPLLHRRTGPEAHLALVLRPGGGELQVSGLW
jgi:membrane-associated phospholipid phosphatase